MADTGFRAPLFLQLPQPELDPPLTAECPECFAVVRVTRLADHKKSLHG